MILNIKYFGLLAEITKCNEENVEFSNSSVSELLSLLFNKYPDLRDKDFQVAQNNEIVSKGTIVSETEIALLPPFSGG
ncbi:MAG TPA: MoaD/ThiS family protein [Flavobacteriaceae bacterium]|nr:MoaD/ThiS family protein [Flavobacteriaceae bacterium]